MDNGDLNAAQSALNAMLTHGPDELVEAMSEWTEMALVNDFGADLGIEAIREYHATADRVAELFEGGFKVTIEFPDGTKIQAVDQVWLRDMLGDDRPRVVPTPN